MSWQRLSCLALAGLLLAIASPDTAAQTTERYVLVDRTAARVRSFNVTDDAEVGSAPTGVSPDHIVVSPNGRLAFVANVNGTYISVVDLVLGAEITRIRNVRARHLALNSAGTRLVAPILLADQVAIIDTSDFSILQVVSLDGLGGDAAGVVDIQPESVVVVGNRAFLNPGVGGRPVFVVDLNTFSVATTANIPANPTIGDTIAATPDGNFVLAVRAGAIPRIVTIDTSTLTFTTLTPGFPMWALAITRDAADPDGVYAYVVGAPPPFPSTSLSLFVLDLNSGSPTLGQFIAQAPLPFPNVNDVEISLTGDSGTAYILPGVFDASPNMAVANTSLLLTNPTGAISARTVSGVRLKGVTTARVPTAPSPVAPQVAGVSPTLVVNNNPNTIRVLGSNFQAGARVRVGSLDPVSTNVLSGGELDVTIPSGAAAQGADIIVTNPNSLVPVSDQHLSGVLRTALVIASPPDYQPTHQVAVANFGEGTLAMLNLSTTATVTPRTSVGPEPSGVAVTPDGERAFAVSFNPVAVRGFNIVDAVVEGTVPLGSIGATAGQARGIGTAVFPPTGNSAVYAVEGIAAGPGVFEDRLVVLDASPPFSRLLTLTSGQTNNQAIRGGLAVSPGGRYAYHNSWIVGSADLRMVVFDVVNQSANIRATSSLGVSAFQALPYVTPDGSWLMLLGPGPFGPNGAIKLFDITTDPMLTGSALHTINGTPPPGVTGVNLGSQEVRGNRLFAFDYQRNVVYVFNFDPATPDFSQLASFVIPATPGAFPAEITATPNGSILFCVLREDGAVAVLDAAALVSGSPAVLLTKIETGLAPSTLAIRPGAATPPGADVTVQPISEVSVTFDSILSAGETTVATTNTTSTVVPSGFQVGNPPVYYEITTTATFSGPIEVCFTYEQGQFSGPESKLRILHEENGVFVDRTLSVDPGTNRICALVDGFSAFVVGLGSVDFLFETLLVGIDQNTNHEGVRRSLQAKVIAARLAFQRGQNQVAISILNALKEEIHSQTGKHLTESSAVFLLNQIESLITAF